MIVFLLPGFMGVCFLFAILFFYRKLSNENVTQKWTIPALIMSIVGFSILLPYILLVLFLWSDLCNDGVLERAHFFNGHIKSLCLERNDGECPKDVHELAAFSPMNFAKLERIANVSYSWDGQEYEFKVDYCGGSRIFSPSYPNGVE